MKRSFSLCGLAALTVSLSFTEGASAQVRITEFMSEGQGDTAQGNGGRRQREFFELTNLGTAPVDTSAWTYNDDNPNDARPFGTVITSIAPGESVILTQMTADHFRTYWNLPASVQVYSIAQLSNLGNADTLNIYNSSTQDSTTLVDTLSYLADARGSGVSRNRPFDGLTGQFANSAWVVSGVGDSFGSYIAGQPGVFPPNFPAGGSFDPANYRDLANPGSYIPAPGAAALLGVGVLLAGRRRR